MPQIKRVLFENFALPQLQKLSFRTISKRQKLPWWFQKCLLLEIFKCRQSTKNHAIICINQMKLKWNENFWCVSTPKNAASRINHMCYKLIGHMTSNFKKGEIKQLTPTFDTGNRIQLNKTMYWFIDFNKKILWYYTTNV